MSRSSIGKAQASGLEAIEAEALHEQASALGHAARKMQAELEAWRRSNGDPWRTQNAADAVQGFFILRELAGMRQHDYAIDFYDIPRAILVRIGAKVMDDTE